MVELNKCDSSTKEADVGITMRNCSTDMARASSGIIIGDRNLSFLSPFQGLEDVLSRIFRSISKLELTMI
ncbi:hypothetical protein CFP56_010792 [Quercus suber]|uniref:Uncharacterized protein n=1 Tax=Quercus suber TaxID=58331 RepID=A0AAW0KZY3_QUESU